MKSVKILLLIMLISGLLIGCKRFSVSTPEDFAEIEGQGRNRYLAVSPEGVRFSLRTVKNYPEQKIVFWQEALQNRMEEAGYALIDGPEKISAKKGEGVFFEWGAPYQGKDYLYFTGLFLSGKKIVIAEAAGPYELYKKYRDTILQTLENLELR